LALVVIAGVNGLRYKLLNIQSGTIDGFDYSYGNLTGQFNKLAGLYESYRLKRISFNWRPEVLQAVGAQGQGVTTIDVAGGDGLNDYPTSLLAFSRSKNTQFHTALGTTTRS